MNISIKSVHIENFKGVSSLDIDFNSKTTIKGRNASGKTTILDAILWLLFGKNSQYVEKFDIRPLGPDGKQINYIDILVSAIFDVDGKEVQLSKKQKQNWVKQRGAEAAVFQGNINSFEIDGYPKSDKEYKAFVGELIDENLFKMLTAPAYFPSMKWKDQRDVLMRLVTSATDVELANMFGGYDLILSELEKATTADIQKKYTLALKELKLSQNELPIRIDEVSKQKVDFDVNALSARKTELETALANIGSGARDSLSAAQTELMETEFSISKKAMELNSTATEQRRRTENEISNIMADIKRINTTLENERNDIKQYESKVTYLSSELSGLGEKYNKRAAESFDESKWVFDENSAKCISCNQMLPATKVENLKADFEKRKTDARTAFETEKQNETKALIARGNEVKSEIITLNEKIKATSSEIDKNNAALNSLMEQCETLKGVLSGLPVGADLMADKEYISLLNQKKSLEEKISTLNETIKSAAAEEETIKRELGQITHDLVMAMANDGIDKRVAELKQELKEVAQKIADCEKCLYVLEEFIKQKLEYISSRVNEKFKIVNFKLFDMQINGGITDCCELTINGVPYSDLNNGHKIVGGLDIINTLSEIYDKHVFVFVDNAESVNAYNLPEPNGQIVRLCVSDDEKLVIEEA